MAMVVALIRIDIVMAVSIVVTNQMKKVVQQFRVVLENFNAAVANVLLSFVSVTGELIAVMVLMKELKIAVSIDNFRGLPSGLRGSLELRNDLFKAPENKLSEFFSLKNVYNDFL